MTTNKTPPEIYFDNRYPMQGKWITPSLHFFPKGTRGGIIGEYCPWSGIIYIQEGLGFKLATKVIFHELCHWGICVLGLPEEMHKKLDHRGDNK